MDNPFPLPTQLKPSLLRVHAYWQGLIRGKNAMPFWDDVKLSALPDLAERLLLVDVFASPERFRFNAVGKAFVEDTGVTLANKFADEGDLPNRLRFIRAQCSATVEARASTFYRHPDGRENAGFSRILLPMWGNGRIGMLLGALDLP